MTFSSGVRHDCYDTFRVELRNVPSDIAFRAQSDLLSPEVISTYIGSREVSQVGANIRMVLYGDLQHEVFCSPAV